MVKGKYLLGVAAMCMTLHSCVKDELPNQECDMLSSSIIGDSIVTDSMVYYKLNITSVYKDSKWIIGDSIDSIFYNPKMAYVKALDSRSSSAMIFQNVYEDVDTIVAAPTFELSKNAKIYPPSGTTRKFVVGQPQYYFVVAEDAVAEYLTTPDVSKLLAAALDTINKPHVRGYKVEFDYPQCDTIFHFENFALDSKSSKYYEWKDPIAGTNNRVEPNWGTANMGFSTARGTAKPEEYPTIPYTDGVEGYGVKLETCSTGSFGKLFKMPLAAGNLFIGEFDFSKALTETLKATRFGRNFNKRPFWFTGYYKYIPGTQMTDKNGNNIDGKDIPAIYAVLYKNTNKDGSSFVLDGENVDNDSEHIVARAQITEWQYNTENYVYFELPFTWYGTLDESLLKANGYNLAIVCSASKDGATYTGALGSKLYVDEFRICCTPEPKKANEE